MLLNKVDLLPYLSFDVERCLEYARRVNPAIEILQVSATTGDGMDAWLAWIGGCTRGARRRHATAMPGRSVAARTQPRDVGRAALRAIRRTPRCACAARCRASASGRSSIGWRTELGLAGWVLQRRAGRRDRGPGPDAALDRFAQRLRSRGAAARARRRASTPRRTAADRGDARLRDPRQRGRAASPRRPARRRHLRRLPGRAASTRATAAIATPSSTARTAARATRSRATCPTTARRPAWRAFALCPACQARVHATRPIAASTPQPNACPACGPRLALCDAAGSR